MSDPYSPTTRVNSKQRAGMIAPILVTTVGTGWLLTAHRVIPGVEWAWVLGLAALGALVLVKGLDKVSVVIGPALMASALLSMLRQTHWIGIETEIPLLTIVVGALWTAALLLPVPLPAWIIANPACTTSVSTGNATRLR
jgi:hypothetical protein